MILLAFLLFLFVVCFRNHFNIYKQTQSLDLSARWSNFVPGLYGIHLCGSVQVACPIRKQNTRGNAIKSVFPFSNIHFFSFYYWRRFLELYTLHDIFLFDTTLHVRNASNANFLIHSLICICFLAVCLVCLFLFSSLLFVIQNTGSLLMEITCFCTHA